MNKQRNTMYKIRNTYYPRKNRQCKLIYDRERYWEYDYLKKKCKEMNLEKSYRLYQVRLMLSYLGVFCILHIFVTLFVCILIVFFPNQRTYVKMDIIFQVVSSLLVIGCLSVNFNERIAARHHWYMAASSIVATLIATFFDLGQCLWFKSFYEWNLYNCYDTYILCMIYMFLPIISIKLCLSLGAIVSFLYIAYYYYNMGVNIETENYNRAVDVTHFFCFNLLGVFYRMMNEILVRSSFLDRQQYMIEEFWLRNARQQEAALLNTIFPTQIAKSIFRSIKERIIAEEKFIPGQPDSLKASNIMAIQQHPDVSILYADLVNYTHLTTTLPVQDLVKVLHDLYGRFDMAASIFNVMRIKFLGDCYYCVAGLQQPDPQHAKLAVSLGISMIANIKEVREERQLDIDMRIGVHSGHLFAGVIGQAKLQFDVWGVDVNIANHLEATGEPGYVHVSSITLSNLDLNEYIVRPGPVKAQQDPVIQSYPMRTYLLTGVPQRDSVRRSESVPIIGFKLRSRIEQPLKERDVKLSEELSEEFKKMQTAGLDLRCCRRVKVERKSKHSNRDVEWCCGALPVFHDSHLEWSYINRTDYVLKYSICVSYIIGVVLVFNQATANRTICIACIYVDVILFLMLTVVLCIAWYKKFCFWKYHEEKEYNNLSCRIFSLWEKVQRSSARRIAVYLFILSIYFTYLSLSVVNCDLNMFELAFIENNLYDYVRDDAMCFRPWVFTNLMALIIGMTFTFAHIPFSLKTAIATLEVLVYLVLIYLEYPFIFHHSKTSFAFLPSEAAHCMRVLFTFFTFYIKEREVEFNAKTNFKLNNDLKNKQKDADLTNQSLVILLNNILPSHVVELYLTHLEKHELYYENYSMVSVMFASLINFEVNLKTLRVLNDLITEFDKLLNVYREYYVVEKIKVVGCTYMAACGLDFNLASLHLQESKAKLNFRLASLSHQESTHEESFDQVVLVMAYFALDLMRTLFECNRVYASKPFDRSLSATGICIGISSGKVMAGIVGASQPHYDIWGNPVNMASRMQSTGLVGKIQVTEESAFILRDFGISCTFRGMTYVKGVNEIPTYFVDIDSNYNFVELDNTAVERRMSLFQLDSTDSDAKMVSSTNGETT
ncbi:adenylyl cyclase X E-like isoform X1 [Drosophila bipectinata]|uniref:adenylyl cyclase X E-like isoform X1 n=3 Tax=Drosophila bipectinata TaxID=42026 RepID=UPI001C89E22C|nr:adenylyl cyclase X E-like isoform X1 [Drosophila bipectinata]